MVNEKKFSANLGISIYTYYSEAIYPENYNNLDEYIKYVTLRWNDICINLYDSPAENFKLYQVDHKKYKLVISEPIRYGILIILYILICFIII